jgi:nucleoside-triphosphatase THEP1
MDSRSPAENSLLEFLLSGKRFLIITGEVNSGKTSTVEKIISDLRAVQKNVGGVYSKGIFSENEKTGFIVVDIKSGEAKQLASIQSDNNFNLNQGRFYFNPEIFREYNTKILNSLNSDVIIIDEVGKLELDEKGFSPSVQFLINEFAGKIILVVRKSLADKVFNKFHLKPEYADTFELK